MERRFLGYLARENDISLPTLRRAVVVGSALASFCVEGIGPNRLVEVSMAEVNGRVAAFDELVQGSPEIALVLVTVADAVAPSSWLRRPGYGAASAWAWSLFSSRQIHGPSAHGAGSSGAPVVA